MNTWKALLVAALAALSAYMQQLLIPVVLMIVVMALDYCTGVGRAWMAGEVSSRIGARGIVKKVGYLALVGVGMVVDYLLQTGLAQVGYDAAGKFGVALLVIVWLIVNECISIIENAAGMGLPVPEFLTKMLLIAKKESNVPLPDAEEKEED